MNQPRLFGPGNDTRADPGLLRDGLQEFAAIFRLARCARRNGDNLINAMGFGQSPEFRQHLECCVHGFRRERSSIEPAGPEPHHFLLAVDDLE